MPNKRKRKREDTNHLCLENKYIKGTDRSVWVPESNDDSRVRKFPHDLIAHIRGERSNERHFPLACGLDSAIKCVMQKVTTEEDERSYQDLLVMLAVNNHENKVKRVRKVGISIFTDSGEKKLAASALKRARFNSSDVAGCSNVGVKKSAAGKTFVPISDIFIKPQKNGAEPDVVIVEGAEADVATEADGATEADVARTLAEQLPTSDRNLAIL